jgi:hypothetical protein
MTKNNNQNWTNIYVLPFKTMIIMASCSFFHSYECQTIQTKNPFDKILSLSFNLKALKANTYGVRRNQFCLFKSIKRTQIIFFNDRKNTRR